ncbi:cytochrome P450 [Butyriboletus roseoflavus]|nr:cytochrome P450 [Butyriboletus roseoflavus]
MRYVTRWTVSAILPLFGLFLLLPRLLGVVGISLSTGASIALLLVTFLAILTAYIVSIEISQSRRAAASGARLTPEIQGRLPGNVDKLLYMIARVETEYLGGTMEEEMQLHGPVVNVRFLWEDFIVTTEPQDIKTILATDFNNYVKGKFMRESADSVLGTGVFNSDGDTWKLHRTMARPFFNIDKISHFDIFDRHAETTVALMKERLRVGLAVDFQDAVSRFTLDSASEFLFGRCVDSLGAGLPFPHNFTRPGALKNSNMALDFAAAFAAAQQALSRRFLIGGSWPLFELFQDHTREPMKVVNAFLDPILEDAIAKQKESEGLLDAENDTEGETLLDHLVRQTTDIKILKDETLNIMLAGRDTTASTLTSVIYLMAMHPDVFRRLREEVLEKVGPTRRPSYEDIREMKFLRAVLNETLRLFPAVPFNIRESINDTTWSSSNLAAKPFFIPAGAIVSYSVLLMHRRTDLWGPDALEFDPDRFLDDRLHKYLTPNPFIFLPFNAGPRMCLGQQFAYNEMSFMLIRLLQNFSSITLSPESQDPSCRPPAAWAHGEGRQTIEQFHPRSHLTLYAKVCIQIL